MRTCSKCDIPKPLDSYRVYRRVRNGGPVMDSACNDCEKQRKRDWWNQNRSRRR